MENRGATVSNGAPSHLISTNVEYDLGKEMKENLQPLSDCLTAHSDAESVNICDGQQSANTSHLSKKQRLRDKSIIDLNCYETITWDDHLY